MIKIQNIYYMLAYAFQVLRRQEYRKCSSETFANAGELLATILTHGIASLLRQGLGREYVVNQEPLSTLKGKIDISQSIKTQTILKRQLVCSYDEFSVDSYMNRVLKSTMLLLLRADISRKIKKELRSLLVYFQDVSQLNVKEINWQFRYNRNNQTYQMLMNVCWLIIKGLLQTDSRGNLKMADLLDEQRMSRLYEKFILEYYRKEYSLLKVSASRIPWQLDDGESAFLPVMQSDIFLTDKEKVLIIDAKYYTHTMQTRFNHQTLHSQNLYQIFTYVKNQVPLAVGEVAGMLLYAKTDEAITPDCDFQMSGNKISVKTLDLNADFLEISRQLDKFVIDFFGYEGVVQRNFIGK